MGKINFRRIDAIRQTQGQIGNHVIDEFVSGRLSRRDFIRRGTIVGLSFPAIGALIAACGGSETSTTAETTGAAPVAGGTLIIASGTPSAASANLDPIAINDSSGIVLLAQYGQWLTVSQSDLTLAGSLATEWVPNDDASEWTLNTTMVHLSLLQTWLQLLSDSSIRSMHQTRCRHFRPGSSLRAEQSQ